MYLSEISSEERTEVVGQGIPPTRPSNGYEDIEKLKRLISNGKYKLDCGHHVTLNHHFGNNIAIINGKELKIICTLCLY